MIVQAILLTMQTFHQGSQFRMYGIGPDDPYIWNTPTEDACMDLGRKYSSFIERSGESILYVWDCRTVYLVGIKAPRPHR